MKKTNLLKCIFALSLVAVLLIATIGLSYLSNNKKSVVQTQTSGVFDESGKELYSGKVYPMAKAMTFSAPSTMSTTAKDGIVVEAIVKPEGLKNKSCDFSIAWDTSSEPGSCFVEEVESNVSIEPVYDSLNNKVRIRCLRPFDTRIVLTATSQLDPSKFDTCYIDYAYRPTSLILHSSQYSGSSIVDNNIRLSDNDSINFNMPIGTFDDSYHFMKGVSVRYSTYGTIYAPTYKLTILRDFSPEFYSIIYDYYLNVSKINGKAFENPCVVCVGVGESEGFQDLGLDINDWSGDLLANIYMVANVKGSTEYICEEIFSVHPELIDLLIDEYEFNGRSVPLMKLDFIYEDIYSDFVISGVNVFLSGNALTYKTISVGLEKPSFVM